MPAYFTSCHLLLYILKNLFFLFALLYFAQPAFCQQDRKLLNGKIKSAAENLEGIYVNNKTANTSVATSYGGYFTINAEVNDTLVFSSVNFTDKQHIVTAQDFSTDLIFIEMQLLVTELDEVVIEEYRDINSESLGLVPKDQKQYTHAEKKLFASQNGVDGIINAITGRTKDMKRAVEIEGLRSLMAQINYIYTDEEITENFKIPEEYVDGFIFYAAEDKAFAAAIKNNNNDFAKFLMAGLAVKYLKIINEDEETVITPGQE